MLNLHRPTCIVRAQQGHSPGDQPGPPLGHHLDLARDLQELQELQESCFSLAADISTSSSSSINTSSSSTSSTVRSSSTSTPPPLEGAFLSLHTVYCPDHL